MRKLADRKRKATQAPDTPVLPASKQTAPASGTLVLSGQAAAPGKGIQFTDNPEAIVSLIGARKDEIISRLHGQNLDSVTMDLTRVLLQAIVDILPSIEVAAKTSSRGVYPLVNLANIMRELTHDLRSMQDRNAMREKVMNNVIDPELLSFANAQIVGLNRLRRFIKDNDGKDMLAAIKGDVAVLVNRLHTNTANELDKYFGGDGKAEKIISEKEADEDAYTPSDGKLFDPL